MIGAPQGSPALNTNWLVLPNYKFLQLTISALLQVKMN
jgi:hypothetical protein